MTPDKTPLSPIEEWQQAMLDWRADVSRTIDRLRHRLWVVAGILAVALVVLGIAGQSILRDQAQGRETDREQFAQLAQVVDDNQQARLSSIRDSCEATNARHDAALLALDTLLLRHLTGGRVDPGLPAWEVRRRLRAAIRRAGETGRQVQQSRDATGFLIRALVPKRRCDQVVAAAKTP